MSILKDLQNKRNAQAEQIARAYVERTCPHCFEHYTLGINGVEDGCDRCEGIVRKPNGMIDYEAMSTETFISKLSEE